MYHLSLIALHAAMVLTAHLPAEGHLWTSIKTHPLFATMQAGGTQVIAVAFVLSIMSIIVQ